MSDRHELQSAGTHPAPCARHCESTAYEIEIRRLRHDIEHHVRIATEAIQEAEQLRTELAVSREREARMRDALDHIARVSMGGRTKSKRNEWIAQRAKSALNGDDDWMRLEKPHGYHRALEGAPGAALAEGAQG